MSPIIHALFVAADQLDLVTLEMPGVCEEQAILLTALARAAQLTAEKLKAEETALERRLMEAAE